MLEAVDVGQVWTYCGCELLIHVVERHDGPGVLDVESDVGVEETRSSIRH